MRLLVLGGTGFLGPHVVAQARARGWSVTVFSRGQSPNQPPDDVTRLVGDRVTGDLDALRDGRWDATLDNTAYVPRAVRQVREVLGDRGGRYVLTSTISVYADPRGPLTERSPLATLDDPTTEEVDGDTYGGLKVLCEQAAGDDAVIVRPGLIVGPGDPTDRFTFWPVRLAEGGDALIPGRPEDPVQLIDVRDLVAFLLDLCAGGGEPGPYNAVCLPVPWGEVVEACASHGDARLRWVPDPEAHGLRPWTDLPLWIPPGSEAAGLHAVDTTRARAAGLRCRPVADTIVDLLTWWRSLPADRRVLRAGMSREREAEVLAALDAG